MKKGKKVEKKQIIEKPPTPPPPPPVIKRIVKRLKVVDPETLPKRFPKIHDIDNGEALHFGISKHQKKYAKYYMKLNEIQRSPEFVHEINRFWNLIKKTEKNEAEYDSVKQLLERIFKLLLPRVESPRINTFISNEMVLLTYHHLFITYETLSSYFNELAFIFTASISLIEIISFLRNLYSRITKKIIYKPDGSVEEILPSIIVSFPSIEAMYNAQLDRYVSPIWIHCDKNEIQNDNFEYKEIKYNDLTIIMKRLKTNDRNFEETDKLSKNIISYNEQTVFNKDASQLEGECEKIQMLDLEYIVPLGFCAESFFIYIANELVPESPSLDEKTILLKASNAPMMLEMEGSEINLQTDNYKKIHAYSFINRCIKEHLIMLLRKFKTLFTSFLFLLPNNIEKDIELLHNDKSIALTRTITLEKFNLESKEIVLNTNFVVSTENALMAINSNINKHQGPYNTLPKIQKKIEGEYEFENSISYDSLFAKALKYKCGKVESSNTAHTSTFEEMLSVNVDKYETNNLMKSLRSFGFPKPDSLENQDIFDYANKPPLCILLLGKPRCGRTTIAKEIAKIFNLVVIEPEILIQQQIAKILSYADIAEEERPKLTLMEEQMMKRLKRGLEVTDNQTIQIINNALMTDEARQKGVIIDLPYYQRKITWAELIRRNRLAIPDKFTYVVELELATEEILKRGSKIRWSAETNEVTSLWEREQRKKPKPKKPVDPDDPDAEPEAEEEENEENKPKIYNENEILHQSCDTEEIILQRIKHYEEVERSAFEPFINKLPHTMYIKVNIAGWSPIEIVEIISGKIIEKEPLIPQPINLDAEGEFKGLLYQNIPEKGVPRKWSIFKQIDVVSLNKGKIEPGTPEFAVSYAGMVFVFANEDNKKAFMNCARKYLNKPPKLPGDYKLCILGIDPNQITLQSSMLSEKYGWRKIVMEDLIKQKIKKMTLQNKIKPLPNNPIINTCQFSQEEYQGIIQGHSFQISDALPFFFEYLGFQIDKKPPPPKEENPEEEEQKKNEQKKVTFNIEDEENKEGENGEEKKEEVKKIEEPPEEIYFEDDVYEFIEEIVPPEIPPEQIEKKEDFEKKEEEKANEEKQEPPPEPEYEDFSISEMTIKRNEKNLPPEIGGYLFAGFPKVEEDVAKLKDHLVTFDKVIILNDPDEENPGKEVKERMQPFMEFDYNASNETLTKLKAACIEAFGEGNIIEVDCRGSASLVHARLCTALDPFYLKPDDPSTVKASAEIGEEDRPVPFGEYGNYDPVIFSNEHWLMTTDPETEIIVNEKSYKFTSTKEAEEFKLNIEKYVYPKIREVPPPHIMFIGIRGSGTTTLVNRLSKEYAIPMINLKDRMLPRILEERGKRKQLRIYLKGYKPPPPPGEDGEEPPPVEEDPEIAEDPEDFDKAKEEKYLLKEIMLPQKEQFYDCDWFDIPEVTTPLLELLFESRRIPEVVVVISANQKKVIERLLDVKSIKDKFDDLVKKRNEEIEKKKKEFWKNREEEIKKKKEELGDEYVPDEEQVEEPTEFDDVPELPEYEKMLQEAKDKLVERYEADKNFIEELIESLKAKGIKVIQIDGNMSIDSIFTKVKYELKQNLHQRKNLIEQFRAIRITKEDIPKYQLSYCYRESWRGKLKLIKPFSCIKLPHSYACLYRDRIYYFEDEDELKAFLIEPTKYLNVLNLPHEVHYNVSVAIIGGSKVGKTKFAKAVCEQKGMVYLKIANIIRELMNCDSELCFEVRNTLLSGGCLTDAMIVKLIKMRIMKKDCQENGWVLDGFPRTMSQVKELESNEIIPDLVIEVNQNEIECYNKIKCKNPSVFGNDIRVFKERNRLFNENISNILCHYQSNYRNVRLISSSFSEWKMLDFITKWMEYVLEIKQLYAKHTVDMSSCPASCLLIKPKELEARISTFRKFCPVSFKVQQKYLNCRDNYEFSVINHKGQIYQMISKEYMQTFIENTHLYLSQKFESFPMLVPLFQRALQLSKVKSLSLEGHSPVTLTEGGMAIKGNELCHVMFLKKRFALLNNRQAFMFLTRPQKYINSQLPIKMPLESNIIELTKFSGIGDSVTFLNDSLGNVLTRSLLELGENRLVFPTLTTQETALLQIALYLKANNPNSTQFARDKYKKKMEEFVYICELPSILYHEHLRRSQAKSNNTPWMEFEENNYHNLGKELDEMMENVPKYKSDNFQYFLR